MKREILTYTSDGYRDLVHEGTFEITDNINIGDSILTHHVCKSTNERILKTVINKRVAYYFNDEPVYNLFVEGGGCYKSSLKLVSCYDRLVRTVPREKGYDHLYKD
jgi:hypothetical protein